MITNTGKIIFLSWYMPITVLRTTPWILAPYYFMCGCKPRLPIDIKFGFMSPKIKGNSHNKFVTRLCTQLWKKYELANRQQCKESAHHKWWYDGKMRASRPDPGDLCLVQQKAFTGKHKIGDHWENTKYVIVE